MPATQADLVDAAGLTPVHINRTIQYRRESGLIVLRNRRLTIPDLPVRRTNALFGSSYIHPGETVLRHPSDGGDPAWAV